MIDSQLRPQGVNSPAVIEAMARSRARNSSRPKPARWPIATARSPLGERPADVEPDGAWPAAYRACATGRRARARGRLRHRLFGGGARALWDSRSRRWKAIPALAAKARARRHRRRRGAARAGLEKGAPYDLILIDGAIEYIPDAIVAQLDRRRPARRARFASAGISPTGRRPPRRKRLRPSFARGCGAAPLPGFVRPRGFTF